MKKAALNIAIAQLNLLVGDIEGNAERIIDETNRITRDKSSDLILFPELSICGYPPEDLLFRPGFHSRCQKALVDIVAAVGETAIVVGYPEYIDDKLYNRAAVIQNKRVVAEYSKQILPNFAVFDEKRYFTSGEAPCVFLLKDTHVGLLICEDIWHPEPAIAAAEAGAELLVTINASPYNREQVRARETMLTMRANETHLPIIYANMVGGQDEVVFDGGSMVVNAKGKRCQQAPYYQEAVAFVNTYRDEKGVITVQSEPLPPRLSEEENIYNTLVLAVRDYAHKNHFPGAILGLSGGIDSALTLAIAVDALGAENVIAVLMPSCYTAEMSIEDAVLEAKALAVKYHIIPINDVFNQFLASLAPVFEEVQKDTTEENLQARVRGTLLMALSNKFGHLVLTTGNRSEMAVGYSTLYGDMAGGFSPLKDVPKTMVYQLANYRNKISRVIPERVITRPPSAELAPGQLDQNSLPPYDILDDLLHQYIDKDKSPEFLCELGYDKTMVDKIIKLVNRNEYKRHQAPMGVRLTQRAFGKDRRYPVTSGFIKNLK